MEGAAGDKRLKHSYMKKSFKPTKKQEAAFEKVVEAIKAAKKAGLRFFGRQEGFSAFTLQAAQYMAHHGMEQLMRGHQNKEIPHLNASVLDDSGADDAVYFVSQDDEELYG